MDRQWILQTEGKEHVVEVDYGVLVTDDIDGQEVLTKRDGRLAIDGNEMQTWEAGQFPQEVSFDIGGKPYILRRKGFFRKKLELFFEGKLIKPSEIYTY